MENSSYMCILHIHTCTSAWTHIHELFDALKIDKAYRVDFMWVCVCINFATDLRL